ncbi:DUF368 domain-containing protein [Vibrio viridaestus]|uniref:DUF368 domain-containing protein n=1 Tax=Vibrio viridaestus TaxID=2487322 RepID=A0A3N9TMP9_9VIBR|nr:DUF368 domain-containing protein [Vibrio viridaestus]RQW64925.1 DUF368 domain-containing protein [Vibrio viridaestus]
MNYLMTFLKGMGMGAADVVPGVSGGTIAFITGVYDTLLESIRRVNPTLLRYWKENGTAKTFDYINIKFLICLFAGILTSVATLAKLISWLLDTHPIPIWSFFFGLIIVSVLHIAKQINKSNPLLLVGLFAGIAIAYSITVLQPLHLEVTPINIVISGAIAICAMILPGISGSFILLMMGMYAGILGAVKSGDVTTLGLFAVGCLIGLLTFSHLLSWLLKNARNFTLTTLTGLMIGTLPKIWPWKETITWRTNSHGEKVPLLQHNLSPFTYEQVTSHQPQLLVAVLLMLLAIVLVLGLEKFADRS